MLLRVWQREKLKLEHSYFPVPPGHPLARFDLLGESKTRLCHFQRPCVLPLWTQVLCQGEEGVGFGRALTNVACGLESQFAKVEGLGETGCGGHHRIGFISPT